MISRPVEVFRFVTIDVICKSSDPPLPDAIYFLASQSIVWPYWQPAGNFTCPKMGSPVVPVKFGLGSSWISTWKANGSCAACTSPNYKDAQRVAFVPNKPPFLNNLNVPLRSRSGTAHPMLVSLWLDRSPEYLCVVGGLQWASPRRQACAALARSSRLATCCVFVISVDITDLA